MVGNYLVIERVLKEQTHMVPYHGLPKYGPTSDQAPAMFGSASIAT